MVTITMGVLTTTSQSIEGRPIREYLGVVSGEALVTARRRRTMAADRRPGIRRADLQRARRHALRRLARRACERGATVVVAIDIDYVTFQTSQLLVTVTGTAARL